MDRCQPWTILLTGTTIVGASWQLLHIPILTVLAGLAIGAWWFVFLVAYPKVNLVLYSTPDVSPYKDSSWCDCIQRTNEVYDCHVTFHEKFGFFLVWLHHYFWKSYESRVVWWI